MRLGEEKILPFNLLIDYMFSGKSPTNFLE